MREPIWHFLSTCFASFHQELFTLCLTSLVVSLSSALSGATVGLRVEGYTGITGQEVNLNTGNLVQSSYSFSHSFSQLFSVGPNQFGQPEMAP
ncbi:MAG: hypothetical protein JNL98_37760 [Bryobacterales bacterium]|nr:hypothetical protein [Bryobacterales bacterium]